MNTNFDFIQKSQKIHGNRYDYSKTVYKGSTKKVTIICSKHGEFEQRAGSHLSGRGCRKCVKNYIPNTEEFIENVKKIHGDKYDYSKTIYKGSNKRITVICPKHGEFEQFAFVHLDGSNCPKCVGRYRYNTEEFIQKVKEIHGDRYDYSKTIYKGSTKKVIIICPEHGEFEQLAKSHLSGHNCSKCYEYTADDFIKKANIIHNNKYDYSKVNYENTYINVIIICPDHGEFEQMPTNHLQGNGCQKCVHYISSAHSEIVEFIKSIIDDEILINHRRAISPYELDIYVPTRKIAIEYHGIYWHSYDINENVENITNQHINKYNMCVDYGIKLYQIFENEWENYKDILKSKLNVLFGNIRKINFNKCKIVELKEDIFKDFINEHCFFNFMSCQVMLGLVYNDKLVSVVGFNKSRNNWEIMRFASRENYVVSKGLNKLYDYFIEKYHPKIVYVNIDNRYPDNLFCDLGFEFDKFINSKCFYFHSGKLFEHDLGNCRRLWDAGYTRFINRRPCSKENR